MIEPKNFRRPKGAAKHRWIGVVVALVLGALAAISLLALEPLDPRPVSTPANEFSAERAFSHVQQIAKRPHPVGSPANAEVRNYLVGQLEDLGLRPTVQEATSARTKEGTASIARGSLGRRRPATSCSSPTTTRCREVPEPQTTVPGWLPSWRSLGCLPRVPHRAMT
jgi:hypothetical protein